MKVHILPVPCSTHVDVTNWLKHRFSKSLVVILYCLSNCLTRHPGPMDLIIVIYIKISMFSACLRGLANYGKKLATCFFFLMIFYWNATTPLYLHIVCEWFHAITTMLSSYSGHSVDHKPKILLIWFFTKVCCPYFRPLYV